MNIDYRTDSVDPVTGARALTDASAAHLLTDIISRSPGRPVIFDLDSTLLNNRPRNATIMREFADQINHVALAGAKPEHFQDWSTENSMLAVGLSNDEIQALLPQYQAFWAQRFFTSHYCQFDVAVAGAVDFVQAIHHSGGVIFYVTGRHEAMRNGTLASLQNCGFPVPTQDNVVLLMKPVQSESDDTYKQDCLGQLDASRPIIAAFDNEPAHINTYRTALADTCCIHLDTDHSMRPIKLLDNIYSIRHFKR